MVFKVSVRLPRSHTHTSPVFLPAANTPAEMRDKCPRPHLHQGLTSLAVRRQCPHCINSVPRPNSPQCSPSRYHSARGCTLFRSGVTNSVHLSVTVSPSLLKVTPNFSRNWTSKWVYGITDESGTVGVGETDTVGAQTACVPGSQHSKYTQSTVSCLLVPHLVMGYMPSEVGRPEALHPPDSCAEALTTVMRAVDPSKVIWV